MILSTHFMVGAAVASQTDSPADLVIIPVILHIILDIIPHWQYVYELKDLKKKYPQLAIDIVIGPLIVLFAVLFFYGANFQKIIWLFAGGLAGVALDSITFINYLFPKNKIAKKITDFHEWIQGDRKFKGVFGFLFQVAIDILAIVLIVLPKA